MMGERRWIDITEMSKQMKRTERLSLSSLDSPDTNCKDARDSERTAYSKEGEIGVSLRKKHKAPTEESHEFAEWKPPAEGQLKANTDGSFVPPDCGGWGYVLRDSRRKLVAGGLDGIETTSILSTEITAIESAMKHSLQLGEDGKNLLVESDSLIAVSLLEANDMEFEEIMAGLDRIKNLKNQFLQVKFQHIPRRLNSVADLMAKEGRRVASTKEFSSSNNL